MGKSKPLSEHGLKLIAVSIENYWRLKHLGLAGDSFNDVVTKLLKETKMKIDG